MKGHGGKLGRKKELLIAALISCPTISDAAHEAGISETTAHRWLADKKFSQQYASARARLLESAGNELRARARGATEILWQIANSKETKPTAKVSACRGLLEFAYRDHEMSELAQIHEMLATLSERFGENGAQRA